MSEKGAEHGTCARRYWQPVGRPADDLPAAGGAQSRAKAPLDAGWSIRHSDVIILEGIDSLMNVAWITTSFLLPFIPRILAVPPFFWVEFARRCRHFFSVSLSTGGWGGSF